MTDPSRSASSPPSRRLNAERLYELLVTTNDIPRIPRPILRDLSELKLIREGRDPISQQALERCADALTRSVDESARTAKQLAPGIREKLDTTAQQIAESFAIREAELLRKLSDQRAQRKWEIPAVLGGTSICFVVPVAAVLAPPVAIGFGVFGLASLVRSGYVAIQYRRSVANRVDASPVAPETERPAPRARTEDVGTTTEFDIRQSVATIRTDAEAARSARETLLRTSVVDAIDALPIEERWQELDQFGPPDPFSETRDQRDRAIVHHLIETYEVILNAPGAKELGSDASTISL